jgi:uroporphyrinogen III methyltransferase/synthase
MLGKVYLVGAGPGDPGLITVKGRQCIEKADVVIYDYLAAPFLLTYAPETAERIYVGKKGGDHTLSQEGINELIMQKAAAGATVTRLKGGDPTIFGRGGEEAQVLAERGIPFEIVPGITSAIAAAAYAGIPLTHRDYTSTLAFVTGHENPEKDTSSIDWAALARGIGTLVFFMGVKNLPQITRRLMENGKPADTPVALVRWGTTARQRTVTGTLETIVEAVAQAKLSAPAITIVGDVVGLRGSLAWFENRPLFGKTIVVTRSREQASDLVQRLTDLGAECLECPTIKIAPPEDAAPLEAALDRLAEYDWLVFTSVNGVKRFFERLFESGRDARALGSLRTAAIGPATAQCLLAHGIRTDILPASYRAESVIEAFSERDMRGKRILLPRALEARPILPVELRRMGARVDEVAVYRTLQDRRNAADLLDRLKAGTIDLITFTSSSTARNFKAMIPKDEFAGLVSGTTIAAIGPITAETAETLGMPARIVAPAYTIDGLCDAILAYYADRSRDDGPH